MKEKEEPEFMYRLRVEVEDLEQKIDGLSTFLKGDTSDIDYELVELMTVQLEYMSVYRSLLYIRMDKMGMFPCAEDGGIDE